MLVLVNFFRLPLTGRESQSSCSKAPQTFTNEGHQVGHLVDAVKQKFHGGLTISSALPAGFASSHGPQYWQKAFAQNVIRLSKQQNDIALVLRHDLHGAGGEREHVATQERFDVLAIQPDDEVPYVFVVHHLLEPSAKSAPPARAYVSKDSKPRPRQSTGRKRKHECITE
jgi:hypothetical protein